MQHARDKHTRGHCCKGCTKVFKTARALEQHADSVHSVDTDDGWDLCPAAPYAGAEGIWVKSFGPYICGCSNRWVSAHAQPRFAQGCQECETYIKPDWMWVNFNESRGKK